MPGIQAQTDKTITRVLVNILWCVKEYLIVRYRSPHIKTKWHTTEWQISEKEKLKARFTWQNSWKPFLCSIKIVITPCRGWTTIPVTRSVSAKDAKNMLEWVWRRRFVFTAKIIITFKNQVNGQAKKLRIAAAIRILCVRSEKLYRRRTGKNKLSQLFSRPTEEDWFIFATQQSAFFDNCLRPNENSCNWKSQRKCVAFETEKIKRRKKWSGRKCKCISFIRGAPKVEKLTNTCEKTSRGWYSRVTAETIKNFQILMKIFLVAGTIPATNVFFHKHYMLPKKQNLLRRWMNLPTKNLKLGNSGISVATNATSTRSRQAERN